MQESSDIRRTPDRPVFWSVWAVLAAFGTYFCMYGFRKPFTAAGFAGTEFLGADFKSVLVIAQVAGYTISKFLGIKIISEMKPTGRAAAILVLIGIAELALVLFGILPRPWNLVALFINGLPLGMVFGLVLGFLEGRRVTEALSAGLCASFILAGGVVKSVGAWLLTLGVTEDWMPAAAGAIFALPLLVGVAMLTRIPPPSRADVAERAERSAMTRQERVALFMKLAPGLIMLVIMFLLLTVLRGLRDDFAPEVWKGLGVTAAPKDFTNSELVVGLVCLAAGGGFAILRNNKIAFFGSLAMCIIGFLLLAATLLAQRAGAISPMTFMVLTGIGLYIPYVVVHTTVFERLLAVTREKGNLGFLMYVADSSGYLGYVAIIFGKGALARQQNFLAFFEKAAWVSIGISLVCLVGSWWYFRHRCSAPGSDAAPAVSSSLLGLSFKEQS